MKTGALHFSNSQADRDRSPVRAGLLASTAALAMIFVAALPLTFDAANGILAVKSAAAGNENGTGDGQGKGRGNGNGQGDENGGGNGGGKGQSPLPNDGGNDDADLPDDVGGPDDPGAAHDGGGPDVAGDIDEGALATAVDAIDGTSAAGPVGAPAASLPTIKQIFELSQESVLSAEAELEAIQNGWGDAN